MYYDIGRKIKTLAKAICWIGIICSIIGGIVMLATMGKPGVLPGILTIILGALFSWVGSFVLYGFGEMVENSDIRTELVVKSSMKKKGQ